MATHAHTRRSRLRQLRIARPCYAHVLASAVPFSHRLIVNSTPHPAFSLALAPPGSNAAVYRARDRATRRPVVVKSYHPRRRAALERALALLCSPAARHPGVVRLEAVLDAELRPLALPGVGASAGGNDGSSIGGGGGGGGGGAPAHLVLEACGGGTLIEAIANSGGRLAERVAARRVVAPLLRALAHLHAAGVVHRDVRPEHVLLAAGGAAAARDGGGGVRLADFSAAALLPGAAAGAAAAAALSAFGGGEAGGSGALACERLTHRAAGAALEYTAPEVLSKPTAAEVFHLVVARGLDEAELPAADEKADVWAVGCLAFEALTGRQPFLADGAAEMAAVVAARLAAVDAATGLPAFIARLPGASAAAKDFVARCLAPRPEQRPGAAELLAHPWLAAAAAAATGGGSSQADALPAAAAAALEVPAAATAASKTAAAVTGGGSAQWSASDATVLVAGGATPPSSGPHIARAGAGGGGSGGDDGDGNGGALHRCASAADALGPPHLSTRTSTGRLGGSMPGTRAAAAAALAGAADLCGR